MSARHTAALHRRPPTLDLDFTAGQLDPRVTFTRAAGAATYYNSAGVRTNAGTDVARFDYNPTTLAPQGLLIEEARSNRLLNSASPVTQTTPSLGTGTYTLWMEGSGSVTSSAGTATATGYGAATSGVPNTIVITGAGTVVCTCAGTVTAFQLELGAFATSFIPTAGALATRAIDNAVINPLGPWYGITEMSVVVEAMIIAQVSVSLQYVQFDDGTSNSRAVLFTAANTLNLQIFGSTATVQNYATTNTVAAVAGVPFRLGLSSRAGFNVTAHNGAISAASPDTSSLVIPTAAVTQLKIGRPVGVLPGKLYIRRIRYWPRALSMVELRGETLR